MNEKQIQAMRDLITFAQAYAEEVYGDSEEEYPGCTENVRDIERACKVVEKYLAK